MTAVSEISFEVRSQRILEDVIPDREPETHVVPVVDGRSLIEILREIELPYAQAEGQPERAGEYLGLSPRVAFLPSRHLLDPDWWMERLWYGNPAGADDKTTLLVCGDCGDQACWGFRARIELVRGTSSKRGDQIVWRGLEQHWRSPVYAAERASGESPPVLNFAPWSYDAIDPLIFDRRQYEQALDNPEWRGQATPEPLRTLPTPGCDVRLEIAASERWPSGTAGIALGVVGDWLAQNWLVRFEDREGAELLRLPPDVLEVVLPYRPERTLEDVGVWAREASDGAIDIGVYGRPASWRVKPDDPTTRFWHDRADRGR